MQISFRFLFALMLVALVSTGSLLAQARRIYPTKIYPGDNIITITNAKGIDRIGYSATSKTKVDIPQLSRCQKEVNLHVHLSDPTSRETLQFTIYECDGGIYTQEMRFETWDIRHERTGLVEVGSDTCIVCEIVTSEPKLVDSITIADPQFSVGLPTGLPPWRAVGKGDFTYQVCFHPKQIGTIDRVIRLYIRRDEPNGGLTTYLIEKPVTATGAPVPIPPPLDHHDSIRIAENALPPLVDPSTFRNIVIPTSETVKRGEFFLADYDLVGILGGYGITDDLLLLAGGAAVPASISKLLVGTIGAKYRVVESGPLQIAVGAQYGYSSTKESDISLFAPYGVISYGNRRNRITLAGGYSFKHHAIGAFSFDTTATILALGGDLTIGRGWKIAAETYYLESSGLAPVAITGRWFNNKFAVDAGFAIDLGGNASVEATGTLSGQIKNLRIAPIVSVVYRP